MGAFIAHLYEYHTLHVVTTSDIFHSKNNSDSINHTSAYIFIQSCHLQVHHLLTSLEMQSRERRLQSAIEDGSQESQIAHQTYLINEECVEDDSEVETENDSDEVRVLKRQKQEATTKRLVQSRTETVGLVNGRWTVLPRKYEFPKGMTIEHLINSWLLCFI